MPPPGAKAARDAAVAMRDAQPAYEAYVAAVEQQCGAAVGANMTAVVAAAFASLHTARQHMAVPVAGGYKRAAASLTQGVADLALVALGAGGGTVTLAAGSRVQGLLRAAAANLAKLERKKRKKERKNTP